MNQKRQNNFLLERDDLDCCLRPMSVDLSRQSSSMHVTRMIRTQRHSKGPARGLWPHRSCESIATRHCRRQLQSKQKIIIIIFRCFDETRDERKENNFVVFPITNETDLSVQQEESFAFESWHTNFFIKFSPVLLLSPHHHHRNYKYDLSLKLLKNWS